MVKRKVSEIEEKANDTDSMAESTQQPNPLHYFLNDARLLHGHLHRIDRKVDDDLEITKSWNWDEPMMMGIDEAGRGPVLGPMVYGSCVAPISMFSTLKSMGFADSKTLNEPDRERLFGKIKHSDFISWVVDPISPSVIAARMLRAKSESLNVLSHNSAMAMVSIFLAKGYNIQELYVDTIGVAADYQAKLIQQFPSIGKIIVASKADATYPIVSAASICAKQTRDHEIADWVFPEADEDAGVEFSSQTGSGYPGDPSTKQWLRDHIQPVFGYPNLVRFSWSTARDLLHTSSNVKITWGDDSDEKSKATTNATFKDSSKQGKLGLVSKNDMTIIPSTKRPCYYRKSKLGLTSSFPVLGVSEKNASLY